jgi:hypothetical protein
MTGLKSSTLKSLAVFSFALLLTVSTSFASEVVFNGKLTVEAVDQFIKQNDEKPVSLVSIFSGGGVVAAGVKLGQWVRKKNADVRVNVYCVSACANYVFPAGKNKIISSGALVLWHGSAQQKNLKEMQDRFRALMAKASAPDADPVAIKAVADGKMRYERIEEQRAMEAVFFSDIGIDGRLFMLGIEPVRYDTEWWTATVDVMEKYGIRNVTAPAGYGTADYMIRSPFRKLFFKNAQLTFQLGADGEVVATPVGNSAQ